MEVATHEIDGVKVAEIMAEGVIVKSAEDGKDLLGNVYYQGFDRMIIHERHLSTDFFDLQNGMAGEILQKFSNYRMRLAIVGDFKKYTRQSIKDFIYESNKLGHINYVSSVSEALDVFTKTR